MNDQLHMLLIAEALNKLGVIRAPGEKRKHWEVDFYLRNYHLAEIKDLYNRRAVRRNVNGK